MPSRYFEPQVRFDFRPQKKPAFKKKQKNEGNFLIHVIEIVENVFMNFPNFLNMPKCEVLECF